MSTLRKRTADCSLSKQNDSFMHAIGLWVIFHHPSDTVSSLSGLYCCCCYCSQRYYQWVSFYTCVPAHIHKCSPKQKSLEPDQYKRFKTITDIWWYQPIFSFLLDADFPKICKQIVTIFFTCLWCGQIIFLPHLGEVKHDTNVRWK